VDRFKQFILSFSDLQPGFHNFNYEIGDWFFEKFDYSELNNGKILIGLTIEKQENMCFLNFNIKGSTKVLCDRCGDLYEQPLAGRQDLIIKVGHAPSAEEDDMIVVEEHDQHYDISQNLFEFISLMLPMHHIHPLDSKGNSLCNKNTLKLLDNLNPSHKHSTNETDPRWDALKKLKSN
jgi:uncharacterized protein